MARGPPRCAPRLRGFRPRQPRLMGHVGYVGHVWDGLGAGCGHASFLSPRASATMPARVAGGRPGHARISSARSGSCTACRAPTAPDSALPWARTLDLPKNSRGVRILVPQLTILAVASRSLAIRPAGHAPGRRPTVAPLAVQGYPIHTSRLHGISCFADRPPCDAPPTGRVQSADRRGSRKPRGTSPILNRHRSSSPVSLIVPDGRGSFRSFSIASAMRRRAGQGILSILFSVVGLMARGVWSVPGNTQRREGDSSHNVASFPCGPSLRHEITEP